MRFRDYAFPQQRWNLSNGEATSLTASVYANGNTHPTLIYKKATLNAAHKPHRHTRPKSRLRKSPKIPASSRPTVSCTEEDAERPTTQRSQTPNARPTGTITGRLVSSNSEMNSATVACEYSQIWGASQYDDYLDDIKWDDDDGLQSSCEVRSNRSSDEGREGENEYKIIARHLRQRCSPLKGTVHAEKDPTPPGPVSALHALPCIARFQIHHEVPDYYVITRVALAAGMRATMSTARSNIFWGKHLPPDKWELLTPVQRVNHFPGSSTLSRKDKLALCLRDNKDCDFLPQTFVLPGDRAAFQEAARLHSHFIWIQKPPASSCGRGIRLIDRYGQVGAKSKTVISRYIDNPLLIDGFKFDIRLYYVVTCMDPLRIFTLDDGLVRFATQKYSLLKCSRNQKRVHLTNFSINRYSKTFVRTTDSGDNGSKWGLKALMGYLAKSDPPIDTVKLRDRIDDIAVRSIIAAEDVINSKIETYRCPRTACFEVFGFDVLLDAEMTPWLLEINSMPSLSSPSKLDLFIKTKLIADVFHMIGLPAAENDLKTIKRAQTRRLKRVIGLKKHEPITPKIWNGAAMTKEKLSSDDIAVLKELEAEDRRRGHLQRIFPTADRSRRFLPMFKHERHNNLLIAEFINLPREEALKLLE